MSSLIFLAISIIAEGFIVLVVAGLLAVMNRSLGYHYQKYWALSWFAFAIYMTLAGFSLYSQTQSLNLGLWKFSLSAITQWVGYLRIYFLLIGTLVMCERLRPTAVFHFLWITAIAILAIIISSILNEPSLRAERYFTRVSLRSFFVGIVSIYCSYLIYKNVPDKLGAFFFALFLTLHGFTQQIFVVQGVLFLIGNPPGSWISLFALADVVLQAFLAFSLVAWVIQNEKEKVADTEDKLRAIALRDPLTDLPNRLGLEKHFSENLPALRTSGRQVAFVFIDLDGFKAVNDSFGHRVGDSLLKEVGNRLRESSQENDMICRFGGDEFAWVLPVYEDKAIALERSEEFRKSIESIKSIEGHPISISCSMGVSWYPEQGATLDELVRESDKALYEAKRHGKNRIIAGHA